MAGIHHEIKIHGTPDRIREALGDRAALEAWHGGRVTGGPGEWRFDFADGAPTFRWSISPSDSRDRVVWRCLEGPGDAPGTEASFTLSPADKERTLVEFAHTGWPHTEGNYRKCNTLWAVLLHHLRQFVETGQAAPALRRPSP